MSQSRAQKTNSTWTTDQIANQMPSSDRQFTGKFPENRRLIDGRIRTSGPMTITKNRMKKGTAATTRCPPYPTTHNRTATTMLPIATPR